MSQVVVQYEHRQLKVKVTPSTLLKEVKERACETLQLDPGIYELQSSKKTILNGSLPFRLSNLSSNAKLQLVLRKTRQKKDNVTVRLQVADLPPDFSDKLEYQFGPTTTVWAILKFFEKSGINFTQRQTNQGFYESPAVQLFNAQLRSLEELDRSLEDLGIVNGNTAFRVRFETTSMSLDDALKKQESMSTEVTTMEPVVKEGPVKSEPVKQAEPKPQPIEIQPSAQALNEQQQRTAQVYIPSNETRPIADDNDDNAGMTSAQFKLYKQQISHQSQLDRQDGPLMPKSLESKSNYKAPGTCTIRVRLPDQTHVEGEFKTSETVGSLQQFVRNALADAAKPFLLFISPPRQYLADPEQSLGDWNFGARQLVFFEWDSSSSSSSSSSSPPGAVLKPELLSTAKKITESESIKRDDQQRLQASPAGADPKKSKIGAGGMPKWLKLGKK